MKNVSKTIAMILVLVMLASSFTGCLTHMATAHWNTRDGQLGLAFIIIDIFTLPVSLVALLIHIIIEADASGEMEFKTYLASADYNSLSEYYPLAEKIYSLSEAELATLEHIYDSIPEVERISSMEKVTSLSETRRASLIGLYNSLPESEIVSSIERISALTETERVSLLRTFNSLSDEEIDSLIEELKTLSKTEYVASVVYSRKKDYGIKHLL